MQRVTVRTLVLMVLLLAYFVAYQCLAFLPVKPAPLPVPGQTCVPKPAKAHSAEGLSGNETILDGPGPWAQGATENLTETYSPGETESPDEAESFGRTWPRLQDLAVDPNDHVPPEPAESSEAGSQDVE
jgi:hypothetical protein